MSQLHTINLPYKQGYVTPVPAAVVVNTYEFREAEDPSTIYSEIIPNFLFSNQFKILPNILIGFVNLERRASFEVERNELK